MSKTRVHNGVTYRWTPRGWKPTLRQGKPVHWSDIHPPGLKTAPTFAAPPEPEDEEQGLDI
jgi:hypothetical protein